MHTLATLEKSAGSSFLNKKKTQPFFAPVFIQPKLTIGAVDDPYEREADAMADKVMRMSDPESVHPTPAPVIIQKKCAACEEDEKLHRKDDHEEEQVINKKLIAELPVQRKCEACEQEEKLGRKESSAHSVPGITPSVQQTLHSAGHSLDNVTRSFMESRFGCDFRSVQIHNDSQAHQSSSDINALAYTHDQHIVFGTGQYQPNTYTGKELLAHELAHVVQQRKNIGSLQPKLFRKVGSVNCAPNISGSPDDPKAALEVIQPLAESLASQAADELKSDSDIVKTGIPDSPSVTFQAYRDNFGLPVARGKGFLNRLTGVVRPSLEIAASEELNILSRRFRFSARLFSQTVNYRCPGADTISLPGCGAGSCEGAFAFSCRGSGNIALCEPFWQKLTTDDARAVALIHESMHIIFGPSGEGKIGEIGETTQSGPGRNFNVAGCYEFIVDALNGADSFPVCPEVPE